MHEVLHMHNIPQHPTPKENIMGLKPNSLCKFNNVKGYPTKYFLQLQKEIDRLIQDGYFKKYIICSPSRETWGSDSRGHKGLYTAWTIQARDPKEKKGDRLIRHGIKKTVGEFFDGGKSIYALKRYARQVLTINFPSVGHLTRNVTSLGCKINLFQKDAITIHPHKYDPLVISYRCDEWEIKRVWIDQRSSMDIFY